MFRHVVVNGISKGEATVVISGDAVFTHALEMQSALSEALESCDHLTIDVGSVEVLDVTFRVLLCSLHRRSELVNKRISMQGALPSREDDRTRYARVNGCLFKGASERCLLWESIVQGGAEGRRTS
jgi:ABC-type transporter Mla MlaB component